MAISGRCARYVDIMPSVTAVTAVKWGDAYKCYKSTKAKRCVTEDDSQFHREETTKTYLSEY